MANWRGKSANSRHRFSRCIKILTDTDSRVGLAFPNGITYVALTFALWRLNIMVVSVPTECPEEEIEEIAMAMQLAGILTPKPRAKPPADRPGSKANNSTLLGITSTSKYSSAFNA